MARAKNATVMHAFALAKKNSMPQLNAPSRDEPRASTDNVTFRRIDDAVRTMMKTAQAQQATRDVAQYDNKKQVNKTLSAE